MIGIELQIIKRSTPTVNPDNVSTSVKLSNPQSSVLEKESVVSDLTAIHVSLIVKACEALHKSKFRPRALREDSYSVQDPHTQARLNDAHMTTVQDLKFSLYS